MSSKHKQSQANITYHKSDIELVGDIGHGQGAKPFYIEVYLANLRKENWESLLWNQKAKSQYFIWSEPLSRC